MELGTLATIIDKYFKSCYEMRWIDENRRDKNGEWIKDENGTEKLFHKKEKLQIKIPTLAGLALELDMTVKEILESKNESIMLGITKIRKEYELRLINRGNEGDIYGLKQFE